MAFLGLRGHRLEQGIVWTVIMPIYLLFGYNNGVAGGLLSLPSFVATFPRIDTLHTSGADKSDNARVQGTVVAIYTLGCFFGCLNTIWLGDRLGRKRTIMAGAAGNILGAILQATAFSLPQLVVGRLVSGFSYGHVSATAPNWQAECSSAKHRGALVLLEGVFISLGLSIVAWITLAISHVHGPESSVAWRFPIALSALWSLMVLAATPSMPDSPRWLVKKGRTDEARVVLAALLDADPGDAPVDDGIQEMEASLAMVGEANFLHVFANGELRLLHRTCLAVCGQIFQQMSGINALAFYEAKIFEDNLGLSATKARILSGAVFLWMALATPLGVLTVDRFGRRKLMLFSAIGMGVCMAVAAGTTSHPDSKAATGVAAAFIFIFHFFFPIGFLGLTFLYAAEISPLSYRVPITSLSTGAAWLFNFVVAEITPVGFATIEWRYFIVYAAINLLLILPGVYFFFPETNGRPLEEVDEVFLKSLSIFDTVGIARRIPKGRNLGQMLEEKAREGQIGTGAALDGEAEHKE